MSRLLPEHLPLLSCPLTPPQPPRRGLCMGHSCTWCLPCIPGPDCLEPPGTSPDLPGTGHPSPVPPWHPNPSHPLQLLPWPVPRHPLFPEDLGSVLPQALSFPNYWSPTQGCKGVPQVLLVDEAIPVLVHDGEGLVETWVLSSHLPTRPSLSPSPDPPTHTQGCCLAHCCLDNLSTDPSGRLASWLSMARARECWLTHSAPPAHLGRYGPPSLHAAATPFHRKGN